MEPLNGSDRCTFDVNVDSNVYSLEVCQKACYAMMGRLSCLIKTEGNTIRIKATIINALGDTSATLEAMLLDELLDYSLREKICNQTKDIRNIILSNAFSNTKLVS